MLRNLIHSVIHIRERVKEKRENEVQTGACCSLLTCRDPFSIDSASIIFLHCLRHQRLAIIEDA